MQTLSTPMYGFPWVSRMEVWEERIRELTPYKVTKEVMENAGEKAIFLHSVMPAFHDWETKIGKEMGERFNLKEMEVTDEVFESEQSVVFDEGGKQNTHHKSSYGGNTWSIKFYVKKEEKWIKRLEILGASAAAIVIVSAVRTFCWIVLPCS